ncbi:MAG: FAD-dependent oxidoreductase [Cyclobacteriaceae bacterium]
MKKQRTKSGDISRREFIKITGASSIALLATPVISGNLIAGNAKNEEYAHFANVSIPVLKKCDVVIVGGGFAGVSAAVKFAKAGKKVVVVDRRIYLGREVNAEYRPWFDIDKKKEPLPEFMQACIDPETPQPDSSKKLLRFDFVKRSLENTLFENGVEIVYVSNVVQVIADGNQLQGVIIGNKSGRQAILSKMVVDCTETASVVHLTNQKFLDNTATATYSRILEYTHVKPITSKTIGVPSELKIKNDKVTIQQGYRGDNHYYIDCPVEFNNPKFDAKSVTNREAEAWEKSLEVAKYLYQNVPEFKDSYFTNSAYQLKGIYTPQMVDMNYSNKQQYLNEKVAVSNKKIALGSFATSFSNLFCISEAAILSEKQTNDLKKPIGACEFSTSVSERLLKNWSLLACEKEVEITEESEKDFSLNSASLKEKYSPQQGKPYSRIRVGSEKLPVIEEVEVLVIGGGTSGAPATYTAAKEGKKTMVVEMNPGFGGTGTYGAVQSYWGPGDYYGLTAEHIQKTTEINKSFSNVFKDNGNGLWNVQAKLAMWLEQIRTAGAQIVWNSFVIGVIMDENKVIGAVISSPQGVFAVKSKVIIDASGDGDVAAFAGAPYVFGSEHDQVPLWYALRKQKAPGPSLSAFESTVDVTNVEDYTRSVHVGVRTGGDNLHDHQPYLAPRESRHILGDVVTTLTDNLTYKEWEDVINIHRANTDMKGYHSSDWFRIGLIPPNLPMELPYRALIPKGVENLIISGKAFSTQHDAASAMRMQPDLENLGGITALAAVQSINDKVQIRNINVKELQKELVSRKILPEKVLKRSIKARNYSAEDVRGWVGKFEIDTPFKSLSNTEMSVLRYDRIPFVEVCTSSSEIAIPVLQEELESSTGEMNIRIALALAMHGSDSSALVIYNEIERQLSSGILPELKEVVRHSGGSDKTPPDQGAAPICANLIYALGMTRSDLNLFAIEMVSEIFKADSMDDFHSKDQALFFYVDAVSYAAGLLGNKKCIPFLKRIHSNKFLNNQSLKKGVEETYVFERLAMMEIILGRALARSGSAEGYKVLIEYLDDMRAVLAGFAHISLVKVTNEDFGKDKDKWKNWLRRNEINLTPVALTERPIG